MRLIIQHPTCVCCAIWHHDVRVAPLHSYKLAAALQAAQAGPSPILLRVAKSAGHGGATTKSSRIDNDAELLAFFTRYLE